MKRKAKYRIEMKTKVARKGRTRPTLILIDEPLGPNHSNETLQRAFNRLPERVKRGMIVVNRPYGIVAVSCTV